MALAKSAIVDHLTDELGLVKSTSTEIVESLIGFIESVLESGADVLMSGLGKYHVRDEKARRRRNPATGEDKTLRANRTLPFKRSGKLRERLNGKR